MMIHTKLNSYHKKFISTGFICIGTALLWLILSFLLRPEPAGLFGHKITFYIDIIPVMLVTSLCGQVSGVTVASVMFLIASVTHREVAYTNFILLMAAIISYIPVSRKYYKSIIKTLITILAFSFLLGGVWCCLLDIIHSNGFSINGFHYHFLASLPACTTVCLFCFLFFTYAPDQIKQLFFCGYFYTDNSGNYLQQLIHGKPTKIGRTVTYIIFGEALLLSIAAALIANYLIPHLDFIPEELRIHRGSELRQLFCFIQSKEHLAFDIKLALTLLNISIPVVLCAIHFAQSAITTPILLMAQAMKDFSGNATEQDQSSVLDIHLLPINANNEIGMLYRILNNMTTNVSGYIEHLKREQELENDLKIEKAANKAKSQFLSNMSHEIRTPINAVLGMDEMILRETNENNTRQYATNIHNAGKTLLSLVNDILDFSKIEAGKMEIIPVQYDLSSMINDLVNMTQTKAEEKHLTFIVNVDKTIPHLLCGDEIRIKQCITNILTNAVKYTEQGSITMNIGWKDLGGNRITLTAQVIDTGIGIRQEDMAKLFHAFERIEERRNRTIEGTGLGMNIVQQLLALMGTTLQVQSEYGKGSDFSFGVEQQVINREPIGDFTATYRQSIAASSNYHESFHAPEARILVVDDTPLNLTVIKGLLKQTLLQIDTAASGQETLALITRQTYNIIFIDHRMPGMDGIETLHAMKTLHGNLNQGVPCIALTANAVAGARDMYLQEGFTDYLTKPIDSAKLENMLIKYLPPRLVTMQHPDDSIDPAQEPQANADSPVLQLKGIDIAAALKNCGSLELLESVIHDFYEAIPSKAQQIQAYADNQDWKNYTVQVHALKSSARLIGALQLSQDAMYLEECGNAQDAAQIAARTPGLISLYTSYRTLLEPAVKPVQDTSGKTQISSDDYETAMANLKECIQAFDFDTADQIITMLDGYIIPDSMKPPFTAIKEKTAAVDRDALLQLFQ